MEREREEMEIDLLEIFFVLKKRFLVILLTAVVFAAAAGAYSFYVASPVYESTSKLYITSQSTSITSLADIQVGSSLALDYLELMKSRPVVEEVIDNLDLKMEYEDLLNCLSVTNPTDTRILTISIQGTNPTQVTQIANEFSEVARKQIPEVMKTDEPSVVEVATIPDNPIKPDKTKNTAMGFLLGAILAALVITAAHLLNDRIKTSDDVEKYLGLNTLAAIPLTNDKKSSRKSRRKNGSSKSTGKDGSRNGSSKSTGKGGSKNESKAGSKGDIKAGAGTGSKDKNAAHSSTGREGGGDNGK